VRDLLQVLGILRFTGIRIGKGCGSPGSIKSRLVALLAFGTTLIMGLLVFISLSPIREVMGMDNSFGSMLSITFLISPALD
jgi:hypothetical protein